MPFYSFLIAVLFLFIFKLFLAGKDATSYKLKDKDATGILTENRIKRWHRDGAGLDFLNTLAVSYMFHDQWWQIFVISGLLRLSIFDISFNYFAGLNYKYLGSTAWFDIFFSNIFGKKGAVKKFLFFALTLVVFLLSKLKYDY